MNIIKLTTLSLFMSGVAFGSVQGHVTVKIDDNSAQISAQNLAVKEGDKVAVLKRVCQGPKVSLCHTEKIGSAVVSRVINSQSSEVKADGKLIMKEGLLVEKE